MTTLCPILADHFRSPRNAGRVPDADGAARAVNEACGDVVDVFVRVAFGRVERAGFLAQGCPALIGAASYVTEWAQGREAGEVLAIDAERVVAEVGETNATRRHGVTMAVRALQDAVRESVAQR